MANPIIQTVTRTTLHAANALSGNGESVEVNGAKAVVFVSGESAGTAGIFTFERSHDGGSEWETMTVTRASDGAEITATAAAEDGNAYVASLVDGDVRVRARISTAFVTASPLVTLLVIN